MLRVLLVLSLLLVQLPLLILLRFGVGEMEWREQ